MPSGSSSTSRASVAICSASRIPRRSPRRCALLVPADGPPEERMRITAGLRASDERWLPVELAGERLADAIAGVAFAAERIRNLGGDEDELAELEAAMGELAGARAAITRGLHDPRLSDIVWLERDN